MLWSLCALNHLIWLVNSRVISIFVNVYNSKKISPGSWSTAAEQSQIMGRTRVLRVKWGSVMSESFTVMNGVKQRGVLSPVLFAVYTNRLLLRLQESGIGHHMGGHYAGALTYADDITLISPSMTGLRKISSICEQCAFEYDILF